MKALHIVNLIEANLDADNGKSTKWEDADLEKIVAKIESGDCSKPMTFGEKAIYVKFRDGDFYDAARKALRQAVVDLRNIEAHEGRNVDHYLDDADDLIADLENTSAVKVGRNYEYVATFAELERDIYRTIQAAGGTVGFSTLGQNVIQWRRVAQLSKSTLGWMWKLNNLRNKHTHTGRALTKAEKAFVASVPERIAAITSNKFNAKALAKEKARLDEIERRYREKWARR